jgi:hypothetical protein
MIQIIPRLIRNPIKVDTLNNHVFYTGVYNDDLLIFIKAHTEVFVFNAENQEFDLARNEDRLFGCDEEWILANVSAIRQLTSGEGFTIKIG